MLRVVIILCILLLALFFLFPDQMEQITEDDTEQISDVVEEVTDRVGDLGGEGESHVSIVPAGTTNLELLLIEAAERDAVDDIRDLLARGANVNGRRTDKASALGAVSEVGHLSVVTLLIGEGAQVDSRDSRGR
jgi:ankyrin repeat protein